MENEVKNLTLGERLKQARVAVRLNIDDVASHTKIPSKYILLLEKSEWRHLPAPVYVRGFLLKYAKMFNLNSKEILKAYEEEFEKLNKEFNKKNIVPELKSPRFLITPKLLAITATIIFLIIVVGYFGWQIYDFLQPPKIVLENPSNDYISNQKDQLFTGFVQKSSAFKINGQSVDLTRDGYFSELLSLNEGLNVIELKAENRFGKEAVIIRKIIYNK